jgi:hypothetical protein
VQFDNDQAVSDGSCREPREHPATEDDFNLPNAPPARAVAGNLLWQGIYQEVTGGV